MIELQYIGYKYTGLVEGILTIGYQLLLFLENPFGRSIFP